MGGVFFLPSFNFIHIISSMQINLPSPPPLSYEIGPVSRLQHRVLSLEHSVSSQLAFCGKKIFFRLFSLSLSLSFRPAKEKITPPPHAHPIFQLQQKNICDGFATLGKSFALHHKPVTIFFQFGLWGPLALFWQGKSYFRIAFLRKRGGVDF